MAYFIPSRVLVGLGAVCFTLFSIVSILEAGSAKKICERKTSDKALDALSGFNQVNPSGIEHRFASYSATKSCAQAHALRPRPLEVIAPSQPVTSITSPMKYSPGTLRASIVREESSLVSTPAERHFGSAIAFSAVGFVRASQSMC